MKKQYNYTENLLVSFSGGETSAFMSQWLLKHYKEYGYKNIVFVFANTGQENEETLEFVERCDMHFGFKLHWVEALVYLDERKSSGYTLTDFQNAKRNGEPFIEVIKKYGIPNMSYPHCTRELKQNPISAFGKVWFNGEDYDTAIGIRVDEFDRVNPKFEKMRYVYPLVIKDMLPTTKQIINWYWQGMPFRLKLKGYQGNCKTCWKKSDKKLFTIAKENLSAFDFNIEMELLYGRVGSEFLKDDTAINRVFFRGNRSAKDIIEQSKTNQISLFDTILFSEKGDGDSCEVFSSCGD